MKKVKYYTNDGKEVKLGDFIETTKKRQIKYGFIETHQAIRLSEESLPYLLDKGLVISKTIVVIAKTTRDKDQGKSGEVTFHDVVNYIQEEIGGDRDDVLEFMNTLYGESTQATYDLIYRKVADILEEVRYGDIPLEGPLYYVGEVDHGIQTLTKGEKYNPGFVTVFRTREDALMAIKVAKTIAKMSRQAHA